MEISPDGRVAAAPQPLRQIHQPAGTPADVPGLRRRADGRDARPAPAEAGRRQADHRRLPDVGGAGERSSRSWSPATTGCGRRRSIPARITPWPSPPTAASSPSTPGCSRPRAEDFPGSKINALVENVAAIWAKTAGNARHADDLLRHGREPDALGLLASMTRSSASSSPAASRASRSPPSATPTRDAKKQALFDRVRQRRGPRADRQHGEDGHRHQRPEAPGRPASPRRPVEAGRGRAARRPHPPPGQRERGSGDLPLRHRRIVRRLYVAGPGDQGPVYFAGDDRRDRRPPCRGHRRPGALLRRGEGDRLGQPGGAHAGRGRRRIAAAGHPEEEPRRRAVPRPPQPPRAARDHRPADQARWPTLRPTWRRWPPMPATRSPSAARHTPSEDALDALGQAARTPCRTRLHETRRYPLGRYRGLDFGLVLHPRGAAEVFLEGATTRHGHAFP